jgi:pyruvate,water dikinase
MPRYVVPLQELALKGGVANPGKFGGKASRLRWLVERGFPVPPSWVIDASTFNAAMRNLPRGFETRSLLRASSLRLLYARAEEARRAILGVALPKGLSAELRELWTEVGDSAPWGLAVRSSATCEDGAQISLAGLADTKLGVFGPDELIDAVRYVWASIASGQALTYLSAHGIRDIAMAVVIQRVVPASAAGVMFTRSPVAEQHHERLVNVGVGLAPLIASGEHTPDVIRMARDGRVLEQLAVEKTKRVIVASGRGLIVEPLATPTSDSLDADQVARLGEIATRIEEASSGPWDVEFAFEGAQLWLLQARPITGRGYPEGGDATTVWTNANVGEALPGVATPLTWSVASGFSEKGFRAAFATLGCSVPKTATLVGNVHGRFYLNVTQFMRVAAQVPWLDPKVLVGLGGVAGGGSALPDVPTPSRRGFFMRLPLTATRLLREQLRLDEMVARYEVDAKRALELHRARDPAILPDEGLARSLLDIEQLLERTGTAMLTCASSSLGAFLAVRMLLSQFVSPEEAEAFAQGLTSGIRDLESARPGIAMMKIAEVAQRDEAARRALEQRVSWESFPEGPTRSAMVRFLELYGDRAVREAELSTPRWREDPTPVLTMVRVALRGAPRDMAQVEEFASRTSVSELERLAQRIPTVPYTALRHMVARAQRSARLREQMRAWVTLVLGMLREIALEADRRLRRLMPELVTTETEDANAPQRVQAGEGAATWRAPVVPESVFFLTLPELVSALRLARTDVGPLIRARKAEFIRANQRPDPPATFTGAPPSAVLPPALVGATLTGVGACAGVAEGRARILAGPHEMGEFQPGEILVVRSTDVGWTPLFLLAAGVVTELGGALSHAAIVAREFSVPTVVSATGATRAIRSGELIRIDGARGTVTRVANPSIL